MLKSGYHIPSNFLLFYYSWYQSLMIHLLIMLHVDQPTLLRGLQSDVKWFAHCQRLCRWSSTICRTCQFTCWRIGWCCCTISPTCSASLCRSSICHICACLHLTPARVILTLTISGTSSSYQQRYCASHIVVQNVMIKYRKRHLRKLLKRPWRKTNSMVLSSS